ncbi:MAG TPA: hypothetical protein ENI64_07620 [Gammaproteobacteria bacterium]|nr:hypothetical protein [Gammaproteobacteria bacterium]
MNYDKERLKAIQQRLGIEADGIFGVGTMSRIEDLLDSAGIGVPDTKPYALTISKAGLEELISSEISSRVYYKRKLQHPIWPGEKSGITIGIGYDIGQQTRNQFSKDWSAAIQEPELSRLSASAGISGEAANQLLVNLRDITISLDSASDIFYTSTLPRYAKKTLKAYPGIELLPADAQAALLSLVYNRGTRMTGASRAEMKTIKPLVANKDLHGIAQQIRAMKRLWDNNASPGLLKRRDNEAKLLENSSRDYTDNELLYV